jgi:hypothetical protein
LLQISSERDRVVARRSRDVINHVVKLLEARNGYCPIAARADGPGGARNSNFCIGGERRGVFNRW